MALDEKRNRGDQKPALLALGKILAEVEYALIGGVALQLYQSEPRTTLDIDLAVLSYADLPEEALRLAGFSFTGAFQHSQDWRSAEGTPVQFSDDPVFAAGIGRCAVQNLDQVSLRVFQPKDLLQAKLRAALDIARRRSKRLQDLADVEDLLQQFPALNAELTPEQHQLLARALP